MLVEINLIDACGNDIDSDYLECVSDMEKNKWQLSIDIDERRRHTHITISNPHKYSYADWLDMINKVKGRNMLGEGENYIAVKECCGECSRECGGKDFFCISVSTMETRIYVEISKDDMKEKLTKAIKFAYDNKLLQ